jgi:hypothetical protein
MVGMSGTQIHWEIPVIVCGADQMQPFSEPCQTSVVSPHGCALLLSRPISVGSQVQLEGLRSVSRRITARVALCISLGKQENSWLLGLALDEPGNVWGVEPVPEDWGFGLQTGPASFPESKTSSAYSQDIHL